MDDESKLQAITDYLSNTLDISSDEEIINFLQDEFNIEPRTAITLTQEFIAKFSTTPIIMETDAAKFINNIISKK